MAKPVTIVVILLLAAVGVANCEEKKSNSTAVASKDGNFLTDILSSLVSGPLGIILKPIGYLLLIVTTPLRGISALVTGIGEAINSLLSGIGGLISLILSTVSGALEVVFKHVDDAVEGKRRRRAITASSMENVTESSQEATTDPLEGAWSWLQKDVFPLLDSCIVKLKDNPDTPKEISNFLGTIHTFYTAIHMLGII